jgi:hypothetical protein
MNSELEKLVGLKTLVAFAPFPWFDVLFVYQWPDLPSFHEDQSNSV